MILVDANVILDVLSRDPSWFAWSSGRLVSGRRDGGLGINPLIYAECTRGFDSSADLDAALEVLDLRRLELPYEAAFAAGRAFERYKRQHGGTKRSPLPDFYIGAHAEVAGLILLTRDVSRYRTYFPDVPLIAPPGV